MDCPTRTQSIAGAHLCPMNYSETAANIFLSARSKDRYIGPKDRYLLIITRNLTLALCDSGPIPDGTNRWIRFGVSFDRVS